jgi:hypothetical protein
MRMIAGLDRPDRSVHPGLSARNNLALARTAGIGRGRVAGTQEPERDAPAR